MCCMYFYRKLCKGVGDGYLADIWSSWTKLPLWVFVKQRQREQRTEGV